MGRKRGEFRKAPDAMAEIVRLVRAGTDVSPHVMLGPVVWQPDKHGERSWYFTVASGDRDGFRVDQVVCGNDEAFAAKMREQLRFVLIGGKPLVIHDFDDELEMARWAEAIWPGPKTGDLRRGVEAERA